MEYLTSHLTQPPSRHAAAAAFDVAIDSIVSFTEEVDASANSLAAQVVRPTIEEVEAFKNWILSNALTPEWRPVIDRIGDGELTWEEIASGDADRDPDVDAAMRSIPKIDRTDLPNLASDGTPAADLTGSPPHHDSRLLPDAADDDLDDDNLDGYTFRA